MSIIVGHVAALFPATFRAMWRFARRPIRSWIMIAVTTPLAASCFRGSVPTPRSSPIREVVSVDRSGRSTTPPTASDRPVADQAAGRLGAATGVEIALVLRHYRAFWTILAPASASPPPRRRALLALYLTGPELPRVLQAMAAQDATGRMLYGADDPRPTVTQISRDDAWVFDCQDAGRSGIRDRSTGRPITVGSARNPLFGHMIRGPDRLWRISRIFYTGGAC